MFTFCKKFADVIANVGFLTKLYAEFLKIDLTETFG
jgi:hypothetical protein